MRISTLIICLMVAVAVGSLFILATSIWIANWSAATMAAAAIMLCAIAGLSQVTIRSLSDTL